MSAKPINQKVMWAYFAPDGYIQVRTIAYSKKLAREMLPKDNISFPYTKYEEQGFYLRRILVNIELL